eukprot:152302-Ditylum_brightwellii.AAC.1
MAITADQIAAIDAATIQAAGLTPSEQSFSDNLFTDDIDPVSKNGLVLFNAATVAVSTKKRITIA